MGPMTRRTSLTFTAETFDTPQPVVIASAAGGMDIEEVAASTPEKIFQQRVDPTVGFQGYQARALAFATGLDGDVLRPATALMSALVRAFEENDGGTLVTDVVRYRLRGPRFLTGIINRVLVAPDSKRIFEFRHRALEQIFDAKGLARSGEITFA